MLFMLTSATILDLFFVGVVAVGTNNQHQRRALSQSERASKVNQGYKFSQVILNWEPATCQPVTVRSIQDLRSENYQINYEPFNQGMYFLFQSFLPETTVAKSYEVQYRPPGTAPGGVAPVSAQLAFIITGDNSMQILLVSYGRRSGAQFSHSFATISGACAIDASVGNVAYWKVINSHPLGTEDQDTFDWLDSQYGITIGTMRTFTPQDTDTRGFYAMLGVSCGTLASSLIFNLNARWGADNRLFINRIDVYKFATPTDTGINYRPNDCRWQYALRYRLTHGRQNVVYPDPNPVAKRDNLLD